jgi:heme/copper-type cytochrome/quinol oxidase subunit 2
MSGETKPRLRKYRSDNELEKTEKNRKKKTVIELTIKMKSLLFLLTWSIISFIKVYSLQYTADYELAYRRIGS